MKKYEVDIVITYEIFADSWGDALKEGLDTFKREGVDACYVAETYEIEEEEVD